MSDEDLARKERRKQKLLKCLALSKSAEPHEAAAAMRQAQKLMAELGLSETDLLAEGIDSVEIKTREGFGSCRLMNMLCSLVCQTFGVDAVFERNPGTAGRLNVRYIGPKDRVMMAEYCHKVLWRAMMKSWDALLLTRPYYKGQGGQRQAFCEAWLVTVQDKVSALVVSDKEQTAIASYKQARYGKLEVMKPARIIAADDAVYQAGLKAAQDFNIHVPLTEEQLALQQL